MPNAAFEIPRRAAGARSRRRRSGFRLRRILVPLDFSGNAQLALRYATGLAEEFGARVVLLHVVPPPSTSPRAIAYTVPALELKMEQERTLRWLQERANKIVPPEHYEQSLVKIGHPAAEIVATAARIEADVIVLTTHGRSGISRFLLGSTAEKVMRLAKCPVLSVRRKR